MTKLYYFHIQIVIPYLILIEAFVNYSITYGFLYFFAFFIKVTFIQSLRYALNALTTQKVINH